MLENFFQLVPIPANQMTGNYDLRLVTLSYIVACLASYIALDITSRLRDITATQLNTNLWISGGAIAMGAGIWSMHFIGMLAFRMNMPMFYDPGWTALSMLVAVGASAFALYLLSHTVIRIWSIVLGGVVLGFAIAAMHYTGMAAMTVSMNIHYLPGLFLLSIVIAIIASEVALYLAIKSTQVIPAIRTRLKIVSALIMGAAICGMHYTGMFAAVFTPKADLSPEHSVLNPDVLAISIAGVTLIILGIAFIVSAYKESLNQRLLMTARQAGMAEVAASVLHNVGNVLNSVNVTSALLLEKINHSKLSTLAELNNLIQMHKNDLANFLTENAQGKNIPEYLESLSQYWQEERTLLIKEMQTLDKNVHLIKNIIASQQDLSKAPGFLQLYVLDSIVDEALLISAIENAKQSIQIEKNYERLSACYVDKVKLLQILVNLIHNAKDAVVLSANQPKIIRLAIKRNGPTFSMMVSDNGIGVTRENLNKIFGYGFTTKASGHGFGLHTSAIAAKEMGGSLTLESAGVEQGATFMLELPYKPG